MPDLLKAEQFVEPKCKPADDYTRAFIVSVLDEILPAKRPTSRAKDILCVSDFLAAANRSCDGLIAWTTDQDFNLAPYRRRVMEKVRNALTAAGWQKKVQKHTPESKEIFQVDLTLIPAGLTFVKNGRWNVVRVRDRRRDDRVRGKKQKGKMMSRKLFIGRIEPLEAQIVVINEMMEQQPLQHPSGKTWDNCFRLFNDGRLDRGGRLYGDWQALPEAERLTLTIGGREVCEIDIKSCFLFIAHQMQNKKGKLPVDPYKKINFVRQQNDPDRQAQMRDFAKQLVSAILSKEVPLTKLPRGEFSNKQKKYISLRDKYALPKDVASSAYIQDVYDAYPFLKSNTVKGLELMFRESEVIVKSLLSLKEKGIAAYPVHDCLLCAKDDEETVIKTLQGEMMKSLGAYAALEVSYPSGETRVVLGSNHDDQDPYDLPAYNEPLDEEMSLVEEWPM